MKRIIIEDGDCNTIRLSEVDDHKPIFAKRSGEFVGMIAQEFGRGWILRLGGSNWSYWTSQYIK